MKCQVLMYQYVIMHEHGTGRSALTCTCLAFLDICCKHVWWWYGACVFIDFFQNFISLSNKISNSQWNYFFQFVICFNYKML
jgi:hypothetical protein